MTNEPNLDEAPSSHREVKQDEHTIGSSSIYRLCEEIIALREINNRQHKMFEQTLAPIPNAPISSFARNFTERNASASPCSMSWSRLLLTCSILSRLDPEPRTQEAAPTPEQRMQSAVPIKEPRTQ